MAASEGDRPLAALPAAAVRMPAGVSQPDDSACSYILVGESSSLQVACQQLGWRLCFHAANTESGQKGHGISRRMLDMKEAQLLIAILPTAADKTVFRKKFANRVEQYCRNVCQRQRGHHRALCRPAGMDNRHDATLYR